MQLPSVRNGSATRGLMSAPRPMKKCKACGRDAVRTEPTAAEQPGIFTLHQSIKAPKHFASLRGLTQLFFFSWVVFSPRICHSHSCQTLSLSGRCTSLIRSWPHTNTHKMLKCLSLALWLLKKKKKKKWTEQKLNLRPDWTALATTATSGLGEQEVAVATAGLQSLRNQRGLRTRTALRQLFKSDQRPSNAT